MKYANLNIKPDANGRFRVCYTTRDKPPRAAEEVLPDWDSVVFWLQEVVGVQGQLVKTQPDVDIPYRDAYYFLLGAMVANVVVFIVSRFI